MTKSIFNFADLSEAVRNAASSSDFKIGVKCSSDLVELMIHGVVGDPYEGLDSASVSRMLADNRGKPVDVDINSGGGLSFDGISIYNALANHDAKVTTRITGIGASAAATIFAAGDERIIVENGNLMIHRNAGIAIGNVQTMMDMAGFLERMDNQLADTYAARTGRKRETILKLMDGTMDGTWFTGKEAVDAGFADTMIPLKKKKRNDADVSVVTSESVIFVADSKPPVSPELTNEANRRFKQMVEARLRILDIDATSP